MAPFSETSNHTNLITPHWIYILNQCKSNSIQIWWKSIQLFSPTTVTSQQKLPLAICLAALSHHWDLLKCHLRETHPRTTQYKFTHHHFMSVLTSYSVYHHLHVCVIYLFSLNQSSRKRLCWQTILFDTQQMFLSKWIIFHSFEELCNVLKPGPKASLWHSGVRPPTRQCWRHQFDPWSLEIPQARATRPARRQHWAPGSQPPKPASRAPTPSTEKPPRCEGHPPRESSLCSPQLEENPLSNGDPAKPCHLMKLSIFKNPLSSATIKCNILVVRFFLNTTQNKDILGMKQLIS